MTMCSKERVYSTWYKDGKILRKTLLDEEGNILRHAKFKVKVKSSRNGQKMTFKVGSKKDRKFLFLDKFSISQGQHPMQIVTDEGSGYFRTYVVEYPGSRLRVCVAVTMWETNL